MKKVLLTLAAIALFCGTAFVYSSENAISQVQIEDSLAITDPDLVDLDQYAL